MIPVCGLPLRDAHKKFLGIYKKGEFIRTFGGGKTKKGRRPEHSSWHRRGPARQGALLLVANRSDNPLQYFTLDE